jgi:branched-chain amino acid transport system permease protein
MVIFAGLLPLLTSNTFVIRIAGNIALMGTLALGLNVVVGYAGLLDLGFVAFFGIGAYAYAYMSSNFSGLHFPTWFSLIVVLVVSILFGLLLGLPSLRLVGDYLAIVTLGFGQIFVQLTTSMTRVYLPGREAAIDLTGGPNGIPQLDPLSFFGWQATSVVDYYYIMLVWLALMVLVVYHLNKSRVGRAWRALREDELAAEVMGMPTRRLKLQAFATGAAIAGLSGALFAGWQHSVFPGNFDTDRLITVYAIIVLGGLGSLPGVILGSIIIIAIPDILRNAALAGLLFYVGVIAALFASLKPRWQPLVVLGGLVAFGIAMRLVFSNLPLNAIGDLRPTGVGLIDWLRGWLVIPADARDIGNLGVAVLVVLILLVTRLRHMVWRTVLLVPTLYLMFFVWETRLSQEPSVTRLILVGVLLVVLMIYRPYGLLGQRRVEVV